MRRLSDRDAMTEARRFKTLTLNRAAAGDVAIPQPTAQNQMIIADATPVWVLLAAPTAQYQVPIAGADPYTPVWAAITVAAISDLAYAVPALTLSTANAEGSADTVIRSDATILVFDATAPNVIQPDDAAAAGSAGVAARRDHEHGIVCATPIATGTANSEGTGTSFTRDDHVHLLHVHDHSGDAGDGGQLDWDLIWSDAVHDHTSDAEGGILSLSAISDLDYAVPALTLSTSNVEGVADTVIRSDATILIFDATVPDIIQPDDAAAAGSTAVAARRDHTHGIVCAAPASPSVNLAASAEGSGTSFARDDHAHQLDQAIAPTWTALHTFNLGITFGGATGVNVVTVPDNVAQAVNLVDAGGIEYLRIVSTDAQPVVVFNEGGADVDHRWEASGQANALFIQGSDGFIALGHSSPTRMLHIKSDAVDTANVIIEEYSATAGSSPDVLQRRARGTMASPADVAVNDYLAGWFFEGYRNSAWRRAAAITAVVESLGASVVRGQLSLKTANAAGALVEHLIIDEDGYIGVACAPGTHLFQICGDAMTTGLALYVRRNVAAASTDSPIAYIHQQNAGDDQAALQLDQAGSGPTLHVATGGIVITALAGGGEQAVCVNNAGELIICT